MNPINYDVQLIAQPDKLSCWAASMAMLISYKNQTSITPESLAESVGASLRTSYGWDTLSDVRNYYNIYSIVDVPEKSCVYYTPDEWHYWLENFGPLWFTFIWPAGGSHAMVIKGIYGDGTPEGTFFHILNPWDVHTTFTSDQIDFDPWNYGCEQHLPFLDFAQQFGDLGYSAAHADYRINYIG